MNAFVADSRRTPSRRSSTAARLAALRRTLGPALARRGPLLRHEGTARPAARGNAAIPYAWTYRDYVIKAFNDDKPYDQFIREQIAADRLDDGRSAKKNPATLAALGFLTLGEHFSGTGNDIINDRIDVTSKAFLGLTVTCARCHDHKFDPIPTADYYSLHGIFASSIEPADKPIIAPPNAAHADYLVKRRDMDERIKTMRDQNIADLFGDYRRHGAVYLLATTMPENQRARYLTKNGADPALLQNWVSLTRPASAQGFPIFEIWAALSRPPAERFAQQAPRVSSGGTLYEDEDGPA